MWVVSAGFGFLISAFIPNVFMIATRILTPQAALAVGAMISSVIGIVAAAIFVSHSRLSERLPAAIPGYELLMTGAIVRALMWIASVATAALSPQRPQELATLNAAHTWLAMPLGLMANVLLLVGSTKVLLAALPRLPRAR